MTAGVGPQSPWDAIVQRALLGTERTAAPVRSSAPGEVASLLGRLDAADAERALLAAAALVGSYEAAGQLPVRAPAQPDAPATPESEDLPPAPARVTRFLATMLGGVNDEVLPEWLAAASARGWRVPTPLLPAVLEAGRKTPALRNGIASVLGARGRWLAARNDDWSYAAGHAAPVDAAVRAAWDTGTPSERAAILEHVRRRDAALGRALLESTWADEAPSQRTTLLALLAYGLSSADESLLEQALDDRRQEVRRIAADLLRRLTGSALVTRMTARARGALSWKAGKLLKRGEIIVEPPSELDVSATRDGVEKKPPQGMGERAWWLAQILAAVPPSVWSESWHATPDTLIAVAAGGDWWSALSEGWAAAAVRHGDAAWAEALLARGAPGPKPTPLAPQLHELLAVLPVERREAFIAKAIRDDPAADGAFALVAVARHGWSDSFARAVLAWMRKRIIAASKPGSSANWQLREIIPRIGLCVPPSLASAVQDWPAGEGAGELARALERFITTLTFRRELAEELDR